jgi:hypothetical protein
MRTRANPSRHANVYNVISRLTIFKKVVEKHVYSARVMGYVFNFLRSTKFFTPLDQFQLANRHYSASVKDLENLGAP